MTELSKKRNKNVLITFLALIFICMLSLLTSCNSKKSVQYVKATVQSTVELPRTFIYYFQSRVMTSDSVIYVYNTNNKYEPGDKIMLPIKDNSVYYRSW